eukprot:1185157-Prorocentrum_minimum.AAC.8
MKNRSTGVFRARVSSRHQSFATHERLLHALKRVADWQYGWQFVKEQLWAVAWARRTIRLLLLVVRMTYHVPYQDGLFTRGLNQQLLANCQLTGDTTSTVLLV